MTLQRSIWRWATRLLHGLATAVVDAVWGRAPTRPGRSAYEAGHDRAFCEYFGAHPN